MTRNKIQRLIALFKLGETRSWSFFFELGVVRIERFSSAIPGPTTITTNDVMTTTFWQLSYIGSLFKIFHLAGGWLSFEWPKTEPCLGTCGQLCKRVEPLTRLSYSSAEKFSVKRRFKCIEPTSEKWLHPSTITSVLGREGGGGVSQLLCHHLSEEKRLKRRTASESWYCLA